MAFAQQLTPEQIAYLQKRAQEGVMNVGGDAGGYTTGPFDWRYDTYSDPNTYGVYDDQGQLQDTRSKESSSAQLGRFLAGAAAMYGLGSLYAGGPLGFSGGASAGVPSSITGLTDTLGGIAPASSSMIPEAAFNVAPGVGGAVGGAAGAGAAAAGGGASGLGGVAKALGSLGPVLGAVGGALTSKDQDQNATSTSKTVKDPYAPAKPFIDQQIAQGQSLANQYQANPFSAGQKQAYNNLTGLLGAINGNLGGLLGGMNAASSGANNFDRANPRKALTGSSFNLSGYAPGLLNLFGG